VLGVPTTPLRVTAGIGYIDFKRSEWEDFHNTVTHWEWERYLTFY
jgi:glutamine synthetase